MYRLFKILLLGLVLLGQIVSAQNIRRAIVGASGSSSNVSGQTNMYWTVGEPIISEMSNSTIKVYNGFHSPPLEIPQAQSITIADLGTKTYGDPSFLIISSATSGLPVTLTSSDPSILKIEGSVATILKSGTVTIFADQPGNSSFEPAPRQSLVLTITKATLTVVADNKSYTSGQTFPALTGTITGVVSGDGITASYTTTATASSPAGTYPITPVLADPNTKLGNYNVALTPGTLTITAPASTIVVDATLTNAALKTGTTSRSLQAKVTNNGKVVIGTVVTFRVFNSSNNILATLTATTSKSGIASTSLSIAKYTFGVYRVNASVSTGQDSDAYLAIYDASGTYMAGAGWIYSSAGSFPASPTLAGNATFGFVTRYQTGSTTVVQGSSSFHLEANDFDFRSTSNNDGSLKVSAPQVIFSGLGLVNGVSGYSYQVSAIDGQFNRGKATDKYRIRIWNTTTSAVVYDNQMGSELTVAPLVGISGGTIILATGTTKREMADDLVVAERKHFNAYPNPFEDVIYIRHESEAPDKLYVELLDLTGKKMTEKEYEPVLSGEYELPVGRLGLSSGFYLLRISEGAESKVVKVFKR